MNPNSKFRLQGIMLASLVFIADQIVKYAMLGPLQLQSRGVIHIISFFDLRYAENRGVSMSFLTADSDGERWALVALTTVIAAGVAVWMWREKLRGDVLALSLVLGGALGNIVDRVRYGYVVDYADLHIGVFRPFYIFNLADACISMGVLILLARAFLISDKQTGDGADVQQPESSADIVEKS
ncbi:signal peptidase II [Sphingorhabdus sp.]|jgi:signal peptidase II|uniref:signal peptidase II n=1 Tax=Sphingorhabdus sp. TaxID=1902408 RepID=UPI0037840099